MKNIEPCQLAGFDMPQTDKSLVGFIAFQNQIGNQRNALPQACSIHGKSRLVELQEFRERVPMGRYGKMQEIAATIAFLASDGAGYITGQNIRVDGGITRSV
jgi:NAD(P)-dependent dehydrogenase (short-subunit alcohol dehydrogenase family)